MTIFTRICGLIICGLALPLFAEPKILQYTIIKTAAHDSSIFTQGLELQGEQLIESSGLYGRSFLTRYNAVTGKVGTVKHLPKHVFAEGLTVFNQQLFLLTWKEGQLFLFDAQSLTYQGMMQYSGEGWGITHDNQHLITSDGSERLNYRSHKTFDVIKSIRVHDDQKAYRQINELEYAQGMIWANMWRAEQIVAINPDNGYVEGILDLSALSKANVHRPGTSVLNGIAYDQQTGLFWVTGKLWPNRYLIKIHWPNNDGAKTVVDESVDTPEN